MKPFLISILIVFVTAACAQNHSHPHDGVPDGPAAAVNSGPVRLTRAIARNLGLETAEVELRPIERTFSALGVVEAKPDKLTAVTSRVSGRVTRLAVRDGQRVKSGDFLFEIESRVVAEPPPRLIFEAPMDGVVLQTHIILGDAVEPDRTLLTLIDLSEVDVVAHVYESRIGAINAGQTVRIRVLAHPELNLAGEVTTTAAGLDRASGTLRVFVHAANPDEKLLPGMRAQLAFVTAESDTAIVVPRGAVLGEAGDLFVFRQIMTAPFAYQRTPVEVGLRDDRFVEIIDGVLPGDRVVTHGNYQLQYVGAAAASIEDAHGHTHGPGGHQH